MVGRIGIFTMELKEKSHNIKSKSELLDKEKNETGTIRNVLWNQEHSVDGRISVLIFKVR